MKEIERLVEAYRDSIVSVALALDRGRPAEVKAAHERVEAAKTALLAHVEGLRVERDEGRSIAGTPKSLDYWIGMSKQLEQRNAELLRDIAKMLPHVFLPAHADDTPELNTAFDRLKAALNVQG